MHSVNGEPLLAFQIMRLKSAGIENIIVATTTNPIDDITQDTAIQHGVDCFRGSEDDVLARYLACCEAHDIDCAIRVGGDDPLIDPCCIHSLQAEYARANVDLVYASHRNGWVYGTAAELITKSALKRACELTNAPADREHVVSFLKRSSLFSKRKIEPPSEQKRTDIFVSVDYQEDLDLIDQIISYFDSAGSRYCFSQGQLISLYDSCELKILNKHLHVGF